MMRVAFVALAGLAGVLSAPVPGLAQIQAQTQTQTPTGTQVRQGRALAEANCAPCHAIGRTGESPLRAAPPFRSLHLRYPVDSIAESLAEGITTAHAGMPQFRLKAEQIDDFLSYLNTLEK